MQVANKLQTQINELKVHIHAMPRTIKHKNWDRIDDRNKAILAGITQIKTCMTNIKNYGWQSSDDLRRLAEDSRRRFLRMSNQFKTLCMMSLEDALCHIQTVRPRSYSDSELEVIATNAWAFRKC